MNVIKKYLKKCEFNLTPHFVIIYFDVIYVFNSHEVININNGTMKTKTECKHLHSVKRQESRDTVLLTFL